MAIHGDRNTRCTENPAQIERACLAALNSENAEILAICRLPRDRKATSDEIAAFLAGMQRLEEYCRRLQPTAQWLLEMEYTQLSQQLTSILGDLEGAKSDLKIILDQRK
jgi:hypothetical protein